MEITKEEKLEQLDRLLHSRALNGSDSLSGFFHDEAQKTSETVRSIQGSAVEQSVKLIQLFLFGDFHIGHYC